MAVPLTVDTDRVRREVAVQLVSDRRAEWGQFMTPAPIARLMAGLFPSGSGSECRLLDAGAGVGSLTAAFLDRCIAGELRFRRIHVDAYEIDPVIRARLAETLDVYRMGLGVEARIHDADFIRAAVDVLAGSLFAESLPRFTHAILNPPYRKIRSDSPERAFLRSVGIETVNLYSAFVALALALLRRGGHLVAIIPRSFCNGPYYKPFRCFMLRQAALRCVHLFDARDRAFKDDGVLQENVILLLERGGHQGDVRFSRSADGLCADWTERLLQFEQVVHPSDPERFIRLPLSEFSARLSASSRFRRTLCDLDVEVSTGPVVDFRMKDDLRRMPEEGAVPLLYPAHFRDGGMQWPKDGFRKWNAIAHNGRTERWLFPAGFYVAVRRFSAKEERRRVVAGVVDPAAWRAPRSSALKTTSTSSTGGGRACPNPLPGDWPASLTPPYSMKPSAPSTGTPKLTPRTCAR